jgi:biopolymer transport protein ExbB/TolQ
MMMTTTTTKDDGVSAGDAANDSWRHAWCVSRRSIAARGRPGVGDQRHMMQRMMAMMTTSATRGSEITSTICMAAPLALPCFAWLAPDRRGRPAAR